METDEQPAQENTQSIEENPVVPAECDQSLKSEEILKQNEEISEKQELQTEPEEEKLQFSPNTSTPISASVNSSVEGSVLKKKRKKGRKIKREKNYPKFYRNAYVRFCEEMRVKVCKENPSLDHLEITKLVAANWLSLDKEAKQPYLDEAQLDKDRYEREMKEYKALNKNEGENGGDEEDDGGIVGGGEEEVGSPSKKSKIKHKDKPSSDKPSTSTPIVSPPIFDNQPSTSAAVVASSAATTSGIVLNKKEDEIPRSFLTSNCELPIFTDAFLEHNKIIEAELKILRKNTIEIEQQNSVLMKHIENMDNGVRKVEAEIAATRQRNTQLEVYLTKLRVKLTAHFNSVPLPNWKNGVSIENIDKYMQDLAVEAQKLNATTSPAPPFINKARDIIKKLDLKIN